MSDTPLPSTLPAASRLSPCFWPALAAAAALGVADQVSKWWIFEHALRIGGEARPFGEWLTTVRHWSVYDDPAHFAERTLAPFANLVMVWNRGVSFGLFSGTGGESPYILIGVAAVIVAGLIVWLSRLSDRFMAAAVALIVSGAVANVHDRLRFGAVADFLDLHVAGYHWPAFNLADSAIVIGAVLVALDALGLRPRRA
jgi:signal peptidase II